MATLNPYLEGPFAPVSAELTVHDLAVEGELPAGLEGMYVRNGPNPVFADPASYHWFLGQGMLHGVELSGGRASYRNRTVRGNALANTHVVEHAGRLLALVEVSLPTEVDRGLETVGPFDFGGRLASAMTAHPHTDPETGEMCFIGYDVAGPPYLRYHVANRHGELVHSAEISLPAPTMMHDFAITATRSVLLDLPVVFDLALFGSRPFPAAWSPSNGARVGVMPRLGTDADVVWIDVEPCYAFHVLNAYDAGDEIVLDLCRYASMFDEDLHGVGGGPARLERWTIDPAARKVRTDVVLEVPVEFPRLDERLVGRRHRTGYLASPQMEDGSFGTARSVGLVAVDLETGRHETHELGDRAIASEPVFVPAADGAEERDGYVLAIVADSRGEHASDLIVLDASDFSGPPLATVHLPQRVPLGFHGSFVRL
ncbi:MAG TPA: carotenoid oxygenase family protein [Acidimicrobiales bacterium]|nr:carotenoid oxygenase family protein [Acidimicrobiales bacterium]